MASLVSRARATALTATLGALYVSAALAADMPFPSQPAPVNQPMEFGAGWYLRGDIGYSNMAVPVVIADFATNLGRTGNVSGGIGIGYQYNNWLRTDVTLDRSVIHNGGQQASIYCPYGNGDVTVSGAGSSGSFTGNLYDPNETCTPLLDSHITRTSALANAYVDLGNWWGFTPYVGAGVGASFLNSSASVNYYENANGMLWAPNLGIANTNTWWQYTGVANYVRQVANPGGFPNAQINDNEYASKRTVKFAWNIMAGVSYDISQNLKVDLHYRLLDAGSFTGLPSFLTGRAAPNSELISQEIRLGFRLTSD